MNVQSLSRVVGFSVLCWGAFGTAHAAEIHAYGFEDGTGSVVARDSVGTADGFLDTDSGGMDPDNDWVTGKFGEGLRFGGTDADQQVQFAASDFALSDAGTIMAWINADGALNPEGRVWQNGSVDTLGYLLLHIAGTGGVMVAEFSGNPNIVVHPSWPSDEWVHVAVTWEVGGNSTVYTNGQVMGTPQTFDTPLPTSAFLGQFRLGGDGGNAGRSFAGIIDELRVYDEALSQGDVQTVMNVPVPAPPPPGSGGAEPLQLVHAYPMDEGSGSNVTDVVGGADGTFGGAGTPAWVAGQSGTALNFDGDAFVIMGNATSFEQNQGGTVMAWMRPDQATGVQAEGGIWRKGSDGEGYSYLQVYAIDQIEAGVKSELYSTGGQVRLSDGPPPPLPGQWNHIAVSWQSGGTAISYRNGQPAGGPEIMPGPLHTTAGLFSIGGDHTIPSAHGRHFHGIIDEVKIFNRFMSGDEVLIQSTNFLSVTEVPVAQVVTNLPVVMVDTSEVGKVYSLTESTDLTAGPPAVASGGAPAVPGTGDPRILVDLDGGASPLQVYGVDGSTPEH